MVEKPRIGKDPDRPKGWNSVIKGAQGNFDHLMAVVRNLMFRHNSLVDDVADLQSWVEKSLDDTTDADHAHDGSSDGGGAVGHGSLSGVTANQHHPQSHTMADHSDGPYIRGESVPLIFPEEGEAGMFVPGAPGGTSTAAQTRAFAFFMGA